jgi:site-specific recombinase XerD
MKTTNFSKNLTTFLTIYLSGVKNLSKNTILAYRDTFHLLLSYCRDIENIIIDKLDFNQFNERLIVRFLDWLEKARDCQFLPGINALQLSIHFFVMYRYKNQNIFTYAVNKPPAKAGGFLFATKVAFERLKPLRRTTSTTTG